MLSRCLVLAMAVPALLGAQGAAMDAASSEPRIVASATRTTRLAADRGVMLVTIEASGENVADASQRASVKLQSVMAALRTAGISADQITVIPFAISPAVGRDPYNQPTAPQMVSRHVIRVPVTRGDQVVALSGAVLSAGAAQAFPQLTDAAGTDSVRRARNAEALQAARADAEALAASLGGKLGALVEVTTASPAPFSPNQSFPLFVNQFTSFNGGAALPEVTVTATVTVRYRFVPR